MAARRGTLVVFVALFVGLAAWLLVRNDAEAPLRDAPTAPKRNDERAHAAVAPAHEAIGVATPRSAADIDAAEAVNPTPPILESTSGDALLLRGAIRDEELHAVAGATVQLSVDGRTARTVSAGDGRYAFARFATPTTGLATLNVWKTGYQPRREQCNVGETPATVELDVVLQPGFAIVGRAVFHGRPAARAKVYLFGDGNAKGLRWCDADGAFAIGNAAEHASDRLVITHGDFGIAERNGVWRDGLVDLGDVELAPNDPLTVRIVDPQGSGVPDLSVMLVHRDGKMFAPKEGEVIWRTRTDASGLISLSGMRSGAYRVLFPTAFVERLRNDPPVVEKTGLEQRVVVDVVRVRVRFLRDGVEIAPRALDVRWLTKGADGFVAAPELSEPGDDPERLVALGSEWRVEAATSDASHRGAVEFSADRSGLVVTVVLR